ncbi:MAG: MBL fold metallo-hydrolase [Clostridia bacterium]|nr:MBL fold metallo-hydrolase [Clostridia bacterium]
MIYRIETEILNSNVFVIAHGQSCVIVDAGATLEKVKAIVGDMKVEGIFLTHGHYDHVYYVREYAKAFGCKVYASELVKEYLENCKYNFSEGFELGEFELHDFGNFVFLHDDGAVSLPHFEIEFFKLGGHSKSDVAFLIDKNLFVGDVLIGREIGRLDLYGGDKNHMVKSLERLLSFDYEIMRSGHGKENTKEAQDAVIKLWLRFLKR